MVNEHQTLVRRVVNEIWNGGNLALIDDLFTQNCVYHSPLMMDSITGREAVKQGVKTMLTAFPNLRLYFAGELVSNGSFTTARWLITGTNRGALTWIRPTNRLISLCGSSVFRFEDSQIAEVQDCYDLFDMLYQLGLLTGTAPYQAV